MISIFLFCALICNTLGGSSLEEVQALLLKDTTFINRDNKAYFEERKRKEEVNKFIFKYCGYTLNKNNTIRLKLWWFFISLISIAGNL